MISQTYYVIRSRTDGKYLTARPHMDTAQDHDRPQPSYLLLFREDYDALSYVNTHGAEVRDRLAVEPISGNQIGAVVNRWGFRGVGVIMDPLLPSVEFMTL